MPFNPRNIKRITRRTRGSKVRLPEVKQPRWKRMVGIGSRVADRLARLPGTVGLAGRVLSSLGNLINVEHKFKDTSVGNTFDNSTGVVLPLTLLAQGTTDSTRNGNSVLSTSIHCNLKVYMHASATLTNVRIILFIDKQNAAGTAPTIAQLLQSTSPTAHLNMNNSDRFVILKSTQHAMVIGTETRQFVWQWQKNLTDLHIKYDGTAADQASAAENHIYLAAISTEPTNTPTIEGDVRYRFVDN